MGSDGDTSVPGNDTTNPPWRQKAAKLVPAAAVVTVVVAAVTTTLMVTHSGRQDGNRPSVVSLSSQEVVRAPPLVVTAPPITPEPSQERQPQRQAASGRTASNAMGASAACRNCGVVESVNMTRHDGAFQLRIRMDDGSLRTIEQRGAVLAGSRVLLERGTVRVVNRQG